MKKYIIAGITITTCVTLCAAVWPRSAEVGDLPAEPKKVAVSAEFLAQQEDPPRILPSADTLVPEYEAVVENEPPKTDILAEKPSLTQTTQQVKPTASSSEPHNGDVRVIDGEKQVYLIGFGWIKNEGGNVGMAVGNPGDKLTGNKVGIMGGGTVAEDMYENGNKIGIMGGDKSKPSNTSPPTYAEPEITGDVIYVPLQPPVTKDSTPLAYKPNGEHIIRKYSEGAYSA